MKFFKKKQVEEKLPEFSTSPTNIQTLNYTVYYMKPIEKVLYFILGFAVGAFVGFLFYGGLAKDQYGDSTMLTHILDFSISVIVGLVAGHFFLPMRVKQIIKKRQSVLKVQFRDLLDGLATSIGAGSNVHDSFLAIYDDLKVQYDADAYIIKELEVIISGMDHNFAIEDLLTDFGNRSGIDDIKTFADVFRICYKKGGNIKDVVRNTHSVLSEKMAIAEDIETTVSSGKMDQYIMLVMPVGLVGIIKFMSPEFAANFATPAGIASTTIAIVCFVAAYFLGKSILEIKV